MRCSDLTSLAVLSALLYTSPAMATGVGNLELHQSDQDGATCEASVVSRESGEGLHFTVKASDADRGKTLKVTGIKVTWDGEDTEVALGVGNEELVHVPDVPDEVDTVQVSLTFAFGEAGPQEVSCTYVEGGNSVELPAPTTPEGSGDGPASDSDSDSGAVTDAATIAALDDAARAWLRKQSKKARRNRGDDSEDKKQEARLPLPKKLLRDLRLDDKKHKIPRNTQFLFHLPSGALAAPAPSSVTEGTPLQVVLLVPESDYVVSAELDVTSCERFESFRFESSNEDSAEKQADEGTPIPTEFRAVAIGAWSRCGGGEFSYDLETAIYAGDDGDGGRVKQSDTTGDAGDPASGDDLSGDDDDDATDDSPEKKGRFTLAVGKKKHIAATAFLGFDTSRAISYGVGIEREDDCGPYDGDEDPGPATGVLNCSVDGRGFVSYVGATWMIGGVDYSNMRWYNYFANPFVAVNLASPTEDVVVGLALTPTGGISLGLGLSIHAQEQLDGYELGDTFSGDGDIPTADRWRSPSLGFAIGVTIDHNVYSALTQRFKKD